MLAEAEAQLRWFHAAIASGVDPEACSSRTLEARPTRPEFQHNRDMLKANREAR
jgi:hypothetical protein